MHIFRFQFYYCAIIASTLSPSTADPTKATAQPTQSVTPTAHPASPTAQPAPPTTQPTQTASPTAQPVTPTAQPETTATKSTSPYLKFECATNGFITDILGVNKEDVVILNGSSSCHLKEVGCKWQNQTKLDVLHVEGENSSEIVGGKHAHFYQLECKTAGAFVASVNTSIQLANPATTDFKQEIKKPTEPTKTIRLTITHKNGAPATTVHIGDPLLLTITGPDNYTVAPISCNASSTLDSDYVLWTNTSCASEDTAVMESTWEQNNTNHNIISITMYGFRFVKSTKVMVTCSAMFCPNDFDCSSGTCDGFQPVASGRKKRHAGVETNSENGYIEESLSTFFTVVDNRMDTSACSGTFSSVFTYVTAFALMLALI
ncbi:unnamed protein product [Mytilus coruscus]|uniref:ZP domain-containing protein n=1 Tax=Mytilus coruscus TaxID=42192 RepID=A0A6J8ALN0_MYTCO|nr:unnamed protein product [Mytilus coruscus]